MKPRLANLTNSFSAICIVMFVMGGNLSAAGNKADNKMNSQRYANCMTLVQSKPEEAFRMASTWTGEGGGHAARHCAAAAMIGMGQPAKAAQRLEKLAQDMGPKKSAMRGDLLGQAASAWMIAAKPRAAYALQTKALELRPRDVELLIDRSISLASVGKYWDAIDDLNNALDIRPSRTEALVFRASAYRRLKIPELATADIHRALEIDPTHPGGLLEQGYIRLEAGDGEGARRDWIKIIRLAPLSPSAKTARLNLEKFDAKSHKK